MNSKFEDFIGIWNDSIDEKLCRKLVKWFDWASEHKYTLSSKEEIHSVFRDVESIRIPHDLNYSSAVAYQFPSEICEEYFDSLQKCFVEYQQEYGIRFNGDDPVDGVLNFPIEGVFRGRGRREIYVDDFVVQYETVGSPSLSVFKNSYIHLTLNLAMKSDVMDEVTQDIIEEHTYHRTVFLGTAYIQTKVTNAMSEDNV